jgi:ligand-binding sensor domain-containing protein/anti-sigma regulatory factor (Ser/Thr protein kinase)
MEDEKGCIWIGTDNGLNILNPITNTIRQFYHQDTVKGSIPPGPIRAIQKMKNGNTWIVGERWMAEFSDDKKFAPVVIDSSLLTVHMVLQGITEHNDQEIWVHYLDQPTILAVKRTLPDNRRILDKPVLYLSDSDYSKIYIDRDLATWGVSNFAITRYNRSTKKMENWIKNKYTFSGPNLHLHTTWCADNDGNIWHGNDRNELVKYNLKQKDVDNYSWLLRAVNATIVYCLYKDNNNTIWVGTDNGIIRLANRDAVFANIPFELNGVELKNIRCRRAMVDRYNNLYAATENYGLLKKTRTARGTDTTIALSAYATIPMSDLPIDGNCIRIKLSPKYDIGYMYDMWYDGKDVIWMAGWGISRFDLRTDSLVLYLTDGDQETMRRSINQFSIAFDGRYFWTAGQNNMYIFDTVVKRMVPFKDNKGNMPFENLPCWALVLKGDWLYAGSANGLYKINVRSKEVIKMNVHRVLDHGINDITQDGDSSFIVSTAGGGLIWFNEFTGEVKHYTNQDGLSNNTVCGLLKDGNDNLWISTYAGLSYFNRQTNQFTNFYTKDGLNIDEFNRKAFFKMPDGRMIFGGLNGYMIFDPDKAFKTEQPVTIRLTRFSKTDQKGNEKESIFDIQYLHKVMIEPGDQFFSFHFMLSDLYDPASNRFFYQLQGVDNAWHPIGNQHFVSFNALTPGTYTLKIKGNTGKGSRSVNELSIDIVVRQVFYRTPWFIALLVLAIGGIAWLIFRYRIRQIQKIQHLRTRIASDLHDDVGSSLVRITVLADAIKREGNAQDTSEQLGAIAGISRGAVSTMKDVVWSIDARNDTMGGMIQYMQEHLHNMLMPANIDFELTHNGIADQEKLAMNFRQNVYLTFKEAINNVVKHSGATRVKVDLHKENGLFVMKIADDGRGINAAKNGNGQGLYNMKLRADRLKADLDIQSEKGVTITLKVPV